MGVNKDSDKKLSIKTFFNKEIPIEYKKIRDEESADGLCYNPHGKNARIIIDNRLGKRRRLNVFIEEITHAFFYDLPEYKVRKFSAELGRILYNQFLKKKK